MKGSSPSIHSSEQFANDMSRGWIEGLSILMGEYPLLAVTNLAFQLINHTGSRDIGDIDVALDFSSRGVIPLSFILPACNRIFRPAGSENISTKAVLCEMKRSCSPKYMKGKVEKFIKFYSILLDPANSSYLRVSGKMVDNWLMDLITDVNVPLLFVFNGADLVAVYNHFASILQDGAIHGHRVIVVFCKSEALITWGPALAIEAELKAKDAELQEKDAELQEKDTELREKDRLIKGIIHEKNDIDTIIKNANEKEMTIQDYKACFEKLAQYCSKG
jgi:hypothetical protein